MGNDRSLDWLIRQRSRVQNAASTLLKVIEAHEQQIKDKAAVEDIAALLVGAAFSLWRAVFLAPAHRHHVLKSQRRAGSFSRSFFGTTPLDTATRKITASGRTASI
jgi:hypothetical protein